MTFTPERLAEYRADPVNAAVHRWSERTAKAAQRELARRHPGEYAAILWEIRDADPRPEAAEEQQRGEPSRAA